jgi:hypothetical protein
VRQLLECGGEAKRRHRFRPHGTHTNAEAKAVLHTALQDASRYRTPSKFREFLECANLLIALALWHWHPKDIFSCINHPALLSILTRMERSAAIQEIREKINNVAAGITAIHPLVPSLSDAPTQVELLKALFELTKQVEVVKKHLLKLEKRDDSSLL